MSSHGKPSIIDCVCVTCSTKLNFILYFVHFSIILNGLVKLLKPTNSNEQASLCCLNLSIVKKAFASVDSSFSPPTLTLKGTHPKLLLVFCRISSIKSIIAATLVVLNSRSFFHTKSVPVLKCNAKNFWRMFIL